MKLGNNCILFASILPGKNKPVSFASLLKLSFVLFRYHIDDITVLKYVLSRQPLLLLEASTPQLHLDVSTDYTAEACAAQGGVYTTGPKLHLDLSSLQRPLLLPEVRTPQGPELYLYMSILQRPELLLEVFTPQGPELHLDLSTLQMPVLFLEVSTSQGPELHLDVSTLQRPVLLLEVSTSQGPQLHMDVSTN